MLISALELSGNKCEDIPPNQLSAVYPKLWRKMSGPVKRLNLWRTVLSRSSCWTCCSSAWTPVSRIHRLSYYYLTANLPIQSDAFEHPRTTKNNQLSKEARYKHVTNMLCKLLAQGFNFLLILCLLLNQYLMLWQLKKKVSLSWWLNSFEVAHSPARRWCLPAADP